MKKETSNLAEDEALNIGVVMPRIGNFKCEHGYLYECWDEEILTEITDKGYVKFYILDYDLKRNYLTPRLYCA